MDDLIEWIDKRLKFLDNQHGVASAIAFGTLYGVRSKIKESQAKIAITISKEEPKEEILFKITKKDVELVLDMYILTPDQEKRIFQIMKKEIFNWDEIISDLALMAQNNEL